MSRPNDRSEALANLGCLALFFAFFGALIFLLSLGYLGGNDPRYPPTYHSGCHGGARVVRAAEEAS